MPKKTNVLLDLLPDPEPEIAHDEEKKEEIEQETETKVKRSKKTSDEDQDEDELMKWLKYAAIGGIGIIAFGILLKKTRKRHKEPDMHDLIMLMMYQTMMQNMQQKNQTLPPQIVTDDNTKFSTDWSKWYDENKGKEFTKFGTSSSKTLNKLHIAENWKVRRELNGKILDVAKTNEYIR